ncbi:hypothetical protein Ahy_A06g029560 [Arachis hypogaea]|uniref:SWIM-type domain-containing protein n=1 Tax=Arachis hypogaea TaxID=3818 RepID=A0A445CTQ6_ARAHY|nr:hypothetical protein Ahy_A06g029560 [Arachis hypogaea]
MRSIAKNKVKLANYIGKLPPVQHSRLQKIRKESGKWLPIWSGDEHYERFEIHGWPTNMVVDLGKSICTCRFWQITSMPCVHACAALSRVNKDPEDFCHKWLTMDSYKATYLHSLNPIPGEALWEKSVYLKPLAPKVKRKPETLTKKEEKMLMRNLQEVKNKKVQLS